VTDIPHSVENWVACDDGVHLIQMSEQLSHYGWVFRKVDGGLPYSIREATPSELSAAKARVLVDQLVSRTSFNQVLGRFPSS